MKNFFIICIVVYLASCTNNQDFVDMPDGGRMKIPFYTSFIQLLASPEKYHGRDVSIGGYVFTGEEKMLICMSLDSVVSTDCLWVKGFSMDELVNFNGAPVLMWGNVNLQDKSYRHMFMGYIDATDIKESQRLSAP